MLRKILVRGASGAGKSTLARLLADRLGVRCIELDALHHGPNWQPASAEELQQRVREAIRDAAGWVVDGNYDDKLQRLLIERADWIVWLDLPLLTKLARLFRRTGERWLRDEELWNGNRESWRGAFGGADALFPWAVRSHFRHRREWPALLQGRNVVRLRSSQEGERWTEQFLSRMR